MHDTDADGVEVASVSFTVVGDATAYEPTLSIAKTTYSPGEAMEVSFTAPSTYETLAWVGIIPSNIANGNTATNDANDVSYEYLDGATAGVLDMVAPSAAGNYDLRMHSAFSGGSETTYVSFTVK